MEGCSPWQSRRSPRTKGHSSILSGSRTRAVRCYGCPTERWGKGRPGAVNRTVWGLVSKGIRRSQRYWGRRARPPKRARVHLQPQHHTTPHQTSGGFRLGPSSDQLIGDTTGRCLKGNRRRMDGNRRRMDGNRRRMEGNRRRMEGNRRRMDGNRRRMEGNRRRMEGNRRQRW